MVKMNCLARINCEYECTVLRKQFFGEKILYMKHRNIRIFLSQKAIDLEETSQFNNGTDKFVAYL